MLLILYAIPSDFIENSFLWVVFACNTKLCNTNKSMQIFEKPNCQKLKTFGKRCNTSALLVVYRQTTWNFTMENRAIQIKACK